MQVHAKHRTCTIQCLDSVLNTPRNQYQLSHRLFGLQIIENKKNANLHLKTTIQKLKFGLILI